MKEGYCDCNIDRGYYGENCEFQFKSCKYEEVPCNGRGKCSDDEFCECNLGYSGESCEIEEKNCITDTEDMCGDGVRGICNNTTGLCDCNINYWGEKCENKIATCEDKDHECQNKGVCNAMYKYCECPEGFEGEKCEISTFNCKTMAKASVAKC